MKLCFPASLRLILPLESRVEIVEVFGEWELELLLGALRVELEAARDDPVPGAARSWTLTVVLSLPL